MTEYLCALRSNRELLNGHVQKPLIIRARCTHLYSQHSGGGGKWVSVGSRTAWFTYQVLDWPVIHRDPVLKNSNKQNKAFYTKIPLFCVDPCNRDSDKHCPLIQRPCILRPSCENPGKPLGPGEQAKCAECL